MKTSKKNVGRRIFSLACWGVCTIIFASGEAQAISPVVPPAPRCTPLNFNISFGQEEEIDITGKSLESDIASLSITNYGGIRCDGSYDKPHPAGGFVIVQTGRSPLLVPSDMKKSQISIADLGGRVGLLSFPTAVGIGYNPVKPHVMPIVLKRKRPGLTEISISDLLGSGFTNNILTAYNNYDWHNGSEPGNGITFDDNKKLRLIYRPTCSASVNNVDFGVLNVGDILKGVTKQAVIDINCNDLLLAYSIKVTSDAGSDDNVIRSENNTIGYRLNWGDLNNTGLDPSLSSKAIELNNKLDNRNDPTSTRFSIPINITPVSRLSFGNDIKPGKADSVINIELQFK
ncbi:TPA: hypothetical protein ACXZX6_000984 [Salmonella enterica]